MRANLLHAKGVWAGGVDLLPEIARGDPRPRTSTSRSTSSRISGFLARVQAARHRYSGGLVTPSDTNTGLSFVTRSNVGRYPKARIRYEGSLSAEAYPVEPK